MPRQAKTKSYTVANPRGIPAGTPVLWGEEAQRHFFEGETFEGQPPERFIRDGFLVEAK